MSRLARDEPAVNGILAQGKVMNAIRKLLAVVAAVLSIAFIFLALRLIGLTLSNYVPSTVFDRVAPWLMVAVLVGLSFVLLRFAGRTLR